MKHMHFPLFTAAFALVFTLGGCGRSEKTLMDQAQSLMDQRNYSEAIRVLENGNAAHGSNEAKTKLGYAYLGAAGVEFSDLARNLKTLEKFELKSFSFSSLPLIHLEHVPSPENPQLTHAFQIFDQTYPELKDAPQELNLLLAAIDFSLAIVYYDRLANLHSGNDVARATQTIINTKHSLNSLMSGMHHLYFSYGKIKRFLKQVEGRPLFRIGSFSYYLNENVTMTNFFDFLTHSGEVEIKEGIDLRANDSKGAATFLSELSQNLIWFRQHTSLDQAVVNQASTELIHISSRIAPKQISLKPLLTPSVQPVRISTADLPKFMQRMVQAVNEAWRTENAQVLFDERARELEVLKELQALEEKWQTIPEAIKDTVPASLISETEEKLKSGGPLEVDPLDSSALHRIATYYDVLDDSIHQWIVSLDQTGSRTNLSAEVQGFLQETQVWMEQNVASHSANIAN